MQFDLGKAIKTLKAQKGITNEDIAASLERTPTTVSQWINGNQTPSIGMVWSMCFRYSVPLSEFTKWGE